MGFNPRPCTRGDARRPRHGADHGRFNPRPCTRGDATRLMLRAPDWVFQSTPLHEGRLPRDHGRFGPHAVSIHAPARGATLDGLGVRLGRDRFNPRPCTRGDEHGQVGLELLPVSIHAPARGATRRPGLAHFGQRISIHAPARGATYESIQRMRAEWFQSTPLHEGRHDGAPLADDVVGVSIHAPARGATAKKQSFEVVAYFKRNPRTVGKNRRFRLPSLL